MQLPDAGIWAHQQGTEHPIGPRVKDGELGSDPSTPQPNAAIGARVWRRIRASIVARNTVLQAASQGFSIATGLVTFAMTTRALGADAYGAFGLASTIAAFVAIVLDAGLDIHVVTELAATKSASPKSAWAHQLVSDAIFVRCALWFLATISAIAIGAAVGYVPIVLLGVALLSVNALIGAVSVLVADIYQAALDVRIAVLGSFLSRAIATILLVGLYVANLLDIRTLLAVTLVSGACGLLAVLAVAIHQGFIFRRPSVRRGWRLYASVTSLALWVVLGQVVHRADVIVLSVVHLNPSLGLSNQHAVGIYVAAYKFFDLSIGLPGFIVISLMPRLAHLASSDRTAYWTYLRRWLGRMAIIGLGVGVLFAVGGSWTVLLVAGPAFERSGPLVVILAGAMPFAFLTSLLFAAIVAIGARGRVVVLYLGVAVFNVGANVFLAPELGYWAAAGLTTVCQAVLTLGMAAILWTARER